MKENMKSNQKKIMLGVAALIFMALIFPPYKISGYGSNSSAIFETGYALIFALPDRATVDVITLIAEWAAICIIGFILYKFFEEVNE